jgi:hypothetical protein
MVGAGKRADQGLSQGVGAEDRTAGTGKSAAYMRRLMRGGDAALAGRGGDRAPR